MQSIVVKTMKLAEALVEGKLEAVCNAMAEDSYLIVTAFPSIVFNDRDEALPVITAIFQTYPRSHETTEKDIGVEQLELPDVLGVAESEESEDLEESDTGE